jgi:hypothetical protein
MGRIVSISSVLASSNALGEVISGRLVVSGRILLAVLSYRQRFQRGSGEFLKEGGVESDLMVSSYKTYSLLLDYTVSEQGPGHIPSG